MSFLSSADLALPSSALPRPDSLAIHLDLVGGISGDMFVAAMADALPALAREVLAQVDKVRARASERGVPPDLCEALWRQMIGWFIQYEEEKLRHQIESKPSG